MDTIELIKQELTTINNKIEILLDAADNIKTIRELKQYNKAIYKCNDNEAIQLINIYTELDQLELKENQLHSEIKQLRHEEYSKECIKAHSNYINNKYRIIIDNENIYTNNIENYINITDKNITIMEYINYNNTIDKTVNMPLLKILYKCDNFNGYRYTIQNIINQNNYSDYKTIYTNLKTGNKNIHEHGLDNNNNDIYFRIDNYIMIHNSYNSSNYISIAKDKISNTYYIKESQLNKYYYTNTLTKEIHDMLHKLLKKLENNKSYKYNIQEIKDILNIA